MNAAKRIARKRDAVLAGKDPRDDLPTKANRRRRAISAACDSWRRPYSSPPVGRERRKAARRRQRWMERRAWKGKV